MRFILYIDPGLGAMLIQAIVATIATAGVFLVAMRKRIASWFKKKTNSKKETDASPSDKNNEVK